MKRYLFAAAAAVALLFGGANTASADFTIQFTGFTMTGGTGTDELTTLTIDGVDQSPTVYTASAVNLDSAPSSFTITNGGLLIDLNFDGPLLITNLRAARSYLGDASSWVLGPEAMAYLPPGEMVVGALLSLSSTNYDSAVSTGTYAGTITIITSAVPEPASMAMLAMGGLGVVGAARRRRNA